MRDRAQSSMTHPGRHGDAVAALPDDLDALIAVVQGLLVHVHLADPVYGVPVDDDSAVHERRVEAILDRVLVLDPAPLDVARPPERRVLGNCRQVSVLLTALLRAHGHRARARCGFGGYFVEGSFEDHWVCERWSAEDGRWALVDAQLDDVQREMFGIDFPITDVPRDWFVVAGDPWVRQRRGEIDPARYGLSLLGQGGASWIAGNLIRDAASLAGTEMLPWDIWGAMVAPDDVIDDERDAFLDRLAALTVDPDGDAHAHELDRLARDDDRLRVPPVVFNALRNVGEPV